MINPIIPPKAMPIIFFRLKWLFSSIPVSLGAESKWNKFSIVFKIKFSMCKAHIKNYGSRYLFWLVFDLEIIPK